MNAPTAPHHLASPDEQRAADITRRMRHEFASLHNAIIAGDKPSMQTVIKALRSFLADDQAIADLILKAILDSSIIPGASLSKLVASLMEDEAEGIAKQQVAELERLAKEDPDNCKPIGMRIHQFLERSGRSI